MLFKKLSDTAQIKKLQDENHALQKRLEEAETKLYLNRRSYGCRFCEHRLWDGSDKISCELDQKKFCDDFLRKANYYADDE